MGVLTSLKNLAMAVGGTGECKTLADCIDSITVAMNPLASLSVVPATSEIASAEDLLGKTAEELQEGIGSYNDRFYGRLKYVTEYTGFSGLEEEQEGNYLALYVTVPAEDGATITMQYDEGDPKTLDNTGLVIVRYNKAKAPVLTFTATKTGHADFVKVLSMKDLILEKKQ